MPARRSRVLFLSLLVSLLFAGAVAHADDPAPDPVPDPAPDTTPPHLHQVTPIAAVIATSTAPYAFNTDEAGTISYRGSCTSTTTDAIQGDNTILLGPLADGEHSDCSILVTDAAGNASDDGTGLHVRSFVVDTTPPTIMLIGEGKLSLTVGDTFTDPGASALDAYDGDVAVTVGGDAVDTATAGTYVITYDAADGLGNQAEQARRTVTVSAPPSPHHGGGGGGGSSRASTGTVGGGQVLGASTYHFSTDLELGMQGADVTALQEFLRDAKYYAGAISGSFDAATAAAVKAYQAAHGLSSVGRVGPQTRALLNQGVLGASSGTTDDQARLALIAKLQALLALLQARLAALQAGN